MMLDKITDALEDALEAVLHEAKSIPLSDLKPFAAVIASDSIAVVAIATSNPKVDLGKLYKELYGQTLLLAEISRLRISRTIMEKVMTAVWTAAQIALKLSAV